MAQKFQISMSLSTLSSPHTLCRWYEWQSGINNWECHRHPQKATRHRTSMRETLTAPKGTALFHNPYLTVINFEASYLFLWHFRTTPSSENATLRAYQRRCKISSPRSNSSWHVVWLHRKDALVCLPQVVLAVQQFLFLGRCCQININPNVIILVKIRKQTKSKVNHTHGASSNPAITPTSTQLSASVCFWNQFELAWKIWKENPKSHCKP